MSSNTTTHPPPVLSGRRVPWRSRVWVLPSGFGEFELAVPVGLGGGEAVEEGVAERGVGLPVGEAGVLVAVEAVVEDGHRAVVGGPQVAVRREGEHARREAGQHALEVDRLRSTAARLLSAWARASSSWRVIWLKDWVEARRTRRGRAGPGAG